MLKKTALSGNDAKEWEIRLVDGRFLWEGRVEVFLFGEWGTVTDDGAYTTDARVVCRQLGYSTSSECLVALKDKNTSYNIIHRCDILQLLRIWRRDRSNTPR